MPLTHLREGRRATALKLRSDERARFADHPQDVFIGEWARTAVSSVMP